jgi:hypothetical protein
VADRVRDARAVPGTKITIERLRRNFAEKEPSSLFLPGKYRLT